MCVHPNKRTKIRAKKGKKQKANEEDAANKNEAKSIYPQGAGRVPKGQGCCLLVRSVL